MRRTMYKVNALVMGGGGVAYLFMAATGYWLSPIVRGIMVAAGLIYLGMCALWVTDIREGEA